MTERLNRQPEAEPIVSAVGVSLAYGNARALDGVSLALSCGVTALVGPNGAGKSTLLRVLAGVQSPDSGEVSFRGEPVRGRVKVDFRRRLGYLPQNPSWHGWMKVRDVVESFAWMRGVPRSEVGDKSNLTLDAVGLLQRSEHTAGSLSGGQFQRLMLATALVHDPEVLLLDEPSVGLDPEQRQQFRDILLSASEGRAILISTHLMDDVATTANRLVVLDQGSVVFAGSSNELTDRFAGTGIPLTTELESAYITLLRTQRP